MNDVPAHTIYTGRSTNWPMLWLFAALLVPLLVMAKGSGGSWLAPGLLVPMVVVVAAATLTILTATSVRTTAGPNGIAVHFGAFGWPRFRYPIARIRLAEAVEIPVSWWAWGLTWSPRRGLMLTLRTGPALRLTLTNGRKVTVSSPDPAAAVHAIADARRTGPSH